jgi:two-component system KDP operon response regulator KdpE
LLDAGGDDYVTKPFNIEILLARIRASLRRSPLSPEARADIIRFGNVEIRMGARRVTADGKYVRLTPREFDLLHFLVSNPDMVLTHERILQAVWGPGYGSEVEYLRVFIKQLRKKIEPHPAKPQYILTEHWLGYRFRMSAEESVGDSGAEGGITLPANIASKSGSQREAGRHWTALHQVW